MKLKFTKQFKYLLIFFIVLISVVYGRYGNLFKKDNVANPGLVKIQRDFKKAENNTRTTIYFSVEKLNEYEAAISKIESEYSYVALKKEILGNSMVYLAEIPDSIYHKVLTEIRSIKSVNSKVENTEKSNIIDTDLNQRLNINITLKEKYLSDLQKTKMAYASDRLRDQLNNVQLSIDSLQTQIKMQKHLKNNNLLLAVVTPQVSSSKSLFLNTTSFATRFTISLVGLTLFIFLILIVMNYILRIMSFLGFHTAKSAGGKTYGSYKYGSSGGSYGYGNYGRKRKVKRIYKDPETGEKTEKTSTD